MSWQDFESFSISLGKTIQHGKAISNSALAEFHLRFMKTLRERKNWTVKDPRHLMEWQITSCHPCHQNVVHSNCLVLLLDWSSLYEIFVPDVSRGWLLAFRGALPIETLSSRSEEAAWIYTEASTLCDAVLICTMHYTNSTAASVTVCCSGKVS